MEKKAIISISSCQMKSKDNIIEVITPGVFLVGDNNFEAFYEETEVSGMDGTNTKLFIKEDVVILEREGTTSTKMEFKKDNSSVALYNTPYGMLELQIITKELNIDINENGGEISINYDLIVGDQNQMDTDLKIKIQA
ncbi:Uncharacterized beta-barrel protein YwiB, DUF1934 family [Clostridium cavendishii DSM 21758]|uniref:Uncharacterized beta-barrel protein YwiB, DUF1934 family n=1 Tax=Clostridium cavendishii DSM 21758 TaxID=1121302 RepID=A0A1M6U5M0_9CLOT|nr:DUF1934 domain-containing protein [Clostridium cavendishii]SHK64565.1 Uncharacterized beta-barrel protein YwiB, DUF1934 family [Clostridium cavendishii DSM 21758]